jgi:hypothetical protein
MSRTPVPSFPAVRIFKHLSKSKKMEEPPPRAGTIADIAIEMMRGMDRGNGLRPIGTPDPLHLVCYYIQSFIPAYPLIVGFTAVLCVSHAIRVEVFSFQRVLDTVLGVYSQSFYQIMRGHRGLSGRSYFPVAKVDDP